MNAMEGSSYFRSTNQRIFCWGRAVSGELGRPEERPLNSGNITLPSILPAFQDEVVQVACGKQHTVFLLKNGLVYSCGSNDFKQLGHNRSEAKPERIEMLENMTIKQIACGDAFTLVLNSQHELRLFGDNQKGQTGNNPSKVTSKPRLIKIFKPALNNTVVVQAVCGASHCLALTASGQVYSWGDNEYGQLGLGDKVRSSSTPTEIASLMQLPIYMIAAGGSHSFALTVSGTLFGWGKNRFGQLGIGNEKGQPVPVRVDSLRAKFVRYVSCGEEHTAVLTKQGQVFTFGYGAKGQLGHGSTENETNPKQVVELMGSVVTQISCGRWHTLAYIDKTSRLYGFGQNRYGQLGDGTLQDKLIPTVVRSTWNNQHCTSNNMKIDHPRTETSARMNCDIEAVVNSNEEDFESHMDVDMHDDVLHMYRIFSGGSQNFALLEIQKPGLASHDMRHMNFDSRTTRFLTEASINQLREDCGENSEEETRKKALDEIAMIFSSASCLNGSFLNQENHETTGLQTHGLSLSLTRRTFVELLAVESIRQKIVSSLKTNLLPKLKISPADIEALRVYLMLPEITIYEKTQNDFWFCTALGERIMELKDEAKRVLCHWWAKLPASFFLRTIRAFKLCFEHGMKDFPQLGSQCITSLLVLQLINDVNNAADGIVPYEKFYIPCIQEKIDVRHDYQSWVHSRESFCFSRFMFVFDVKAKAVILETDAHLKMAREMENTCLQNMILSTYKPSNPFLVFHIRRGDDLVQDTLHEIQKHVERTSEFMKPLKVVFQGEEGIDAGGPRKEFFLLLIKEIFDRKYGMFKEIESSRTVWFDSQTFEDPKMYFMIGLICGLALYNSVIIDVHFPPVLYKKLLDQKTTLEDFRGFDPDYARTLQYLLDYVDDESGNVEDVFMLNFQVEEIVFGETIFVDLKENGKEINLTADNREEYVEAVIDYKLNRSIKNQFEKFKDGFYTVCDRHLLSCWHPQELMEMIAGCEDYYDFMKLEETAEYDGYNRGDKVIRLFWQVLKEFDLDLKKKFLAFLTGSDKIPVQGINSVKMKIKPLGDPAQQDLLPQAATCFNTFLLPRYESKELMDSKLKLAMKNEFSKGFGLE